MTEAQVRRAAHLWLDQANLNLGGFGFWDLGFRELQVRIFGRPCLDALVWGSGFRDSGLGPLEGFASFISRPFDQGCFYCGVGSLDQGSSSCGSRISLGLGFRV